MIVPLQRAGLASANAHRRLSAALLLAGTLALFAGCETLPVEESKRLMGTEVRIVVHAVGGELDAGLARDAIYLAFKEIDRVERMAWSEEMADLNARAGVAAAPVRPELVELIHRGYDMAERTELAFRPDLGPLIRLWAIGTDSARLPAWWEIERALQIADSTSFTQIDSGLAKLAPRGAALDLGGIAKGYAVDRAVRRMQQVGVTAGMVWAGGDLRVFGSKPSGEPWRIAVRHPRGEGYLSVLELDSGAVATSGDYERVSELAGGRYHHILSPATGYPSTASVSATVVAPSCEQADAWATALFVMGPEHGAFIASQENLAVLLADLDADSTLQIEATDRYLALETERTP